MIRFSHASVLSFGIIMGVLATLLNLTGINLGYLYKLVCFSLLVMARSIEETKSAFFGIDGCDHFFGGGTDHADAAMEQAEQVCGDVFADLWVCVGDDHVADDDVWALRRGDGGYNEPEPADDGRQPGGAVLAVDFERSDLTRETGPFYI